MFQPGDSVFVKNSAETDIQGYAWNYIKSHREAQVVCILISTTKYEIPDSEQLYVLVWPDEFSGGWDCWNNCPAKRGQIVTHKHLELNFEKSRTVVTVPNIEVAL